MAARPGVTRIQGGDRCATAVEISKENLASGVDIVFVASGASSPDALSGAPIAGMTGSTVLLIPGTTIPAVVHQELTRLAPQYIVVLGGEGVVSAAVADQLEGFAQMGIVDRLAGYNRFATSASISNAVFSEQRPEVVYIANGKMFPDALAVAPVGAIVDAPILLVSATSIPTAVKDELLVREPQQIVIVGGPAAVSDAVAEQVGAYVVP